jgi:hypothetical protein
MAQEQHTPALCPLIGASTPCKSSKTTLTISRRIRGGRGGTQVPSVSGFSGKIATCAELRLLCKTFVSTYPSTTNNMDKHVGIKEEPSADAVAERKNSYVATEKTQWERLWPVIACGAGLFSDGYLNGVIGSVSTMLAILYPKQYNNSPAQSNVGSITFVGTLLGNLIFGWTSDHWSRKWSLFWSTIIIIVFAALSTGSYGAGGSVEGLFAALTAYRFFLGIGIGVRLPRTVSLRLHNADEAQFHAGRISSRLSWLRGEHWRA